MRIGNPVPQLHLPTTTRHIRMGSTHPSQKLEENTPMCWTYRSLHEYIAPGHYLPEFLDPQKLKGLKILDVACGQGGFVYDLRRGLDITHRKDSQASWSERLMTTFPLLKPLCRPFYRLKEDDINIIGIDTEVTPRMEKTGWFVKGDARKMSMFANEHFDLVYSAWSMFSIANVPPTIQRDTMREMYRVLKPGGRIRLGGVIANRQQEVEAAVTQCPGLKIISPITIPASNAHVEILKTH